MASSLHLLIQVQPLPNFPSITAPLFPQKPFHIPSLTSLKPSNKLLFSKPLTVPFALTESSDSPNSLQPNNSAQSLLQQLADSFDLPQDYFSQLPSDLRIDLNDAAFDLSNGPEIDEEKGTCHSKKMEMSTISSESSYEKELECKEIIIQNPQWRPQCCIYKVPKRLREVKKEAYAPRLISVGPLHRKIDASNEMEMLKQKYFQEFFHRTWKRPNGI